MLQWRQGGTLSGHMLGSPNGFSGEYATRGGRCAGVGAGVELCGPQQPCHGGTAGTGRIRADELAVGVGGVGAGSCNRAAWTGQRICDDVLRASGAGSGGVRDVSQYPDDRESEFRAGGARTGEQPDQFGTGIWTDDRDAVWGTGDGSFWVAAVDHGAGQVTYGQILQRREFWGMALGMFALNYAFYFVFIWLPSYVVKAGGFAVGEMASIVAAIYGVYGVTTALCGRVADRQVMRGSTATQVWKRIVMVGGTGAMVSIAGCAFVEARMAVWLLGVTGALPGLRAAGRWREHRQWPGSWLEWYRPL